MNDFEMKKGSDIVNDLRGLVKMAWDVSHNISKMENEIMKCNFFIAISISFFYAIIAVGVLIDLHHHSDSSSSLLFFGDNVLIIRVVIFFLAFACSFSSLYFFLVKRRRLRNDIESEQDVLNQLLAVTFDIRRSMSYKQQKESILEYIAIDLDLKRIKFSASRKSKKNKDKEIS